MKSRGLGFEFESRTWQRKQKPRADKQGELTKIAVFEELNFYRTEATGRV
jgi:hypothetical protein